ncbi:Protein PLANT CADMIUM RESISTANCE 8, partial [Ananas comosus]
CALGSFLYMFMGPALCTCWVLGANYRSKLREKYNLVEAPAEDWVLHLFCSCCALCQEFRELQNRGIDPSLGWMGHLAQKQEARAVPPQTQSMSA